MLWQMKKMILAARVVAKEEPTWLHHWGWLLELAIGLVVLFALSYGLRRLIKYLRKRLFTKLGTRGERLEQIIALPLQLVIWIVAIVFAIDLLNTHFKLAILPAYLNIIRNGFIALAITWMVLRWLKVARHILVQKSRNLGLDPGTIHGLGKITSIIVFILAFLLILQIFGLNVLPLLAFGGIGAAAIGFSAKDVIANFFGGLMLHMTGPFMIGEQIIIPNQNNLQGIVEEIGWYITTIRDVEKRPVYLPNSFFSSMIVINMSRMSHRRIYEIIQIRCEDFEKLPTIIEGIKEEVQKHERIDNLVPINVVFDKFSEYSLDLRLDVYTLATKYDEFLRVKEDILMRIGKVVAAHQAETSLPIRVIQVKNIS
ncbi:MAG: mechanosensitive ion channel family protein [Chlamydiae bacterium]|nr:mechanosensitive ion channel family protein [Chlamydiota bacterium]